jgi:hypothetical protein
MDCTPASITEVNQLDAAVTRAGFFNTIHLQRPLEDNVLKLVATDARADPAVPA